MSKMDYKYSDADAPQNEVNEPLVAYALSPSSHRENDTLFIIKSINNGISYQTYAKIRDESPYDDTVWARFLQVSTKTMERYSKNNRVFKPLQSEKIIELSEVFAVGLEYFEDTQKFKLWMETPNFGLGGQKPLELLSTSYGKDLVLDILVSAEHGVFI